MLITIITVCFNSIKTIKDTLNSIWEQDFSNIELIVVDGSSTDGTFEYLLANKHRINHLISERDFGVYDAMNKGLCLATGDIVGIINSDDILSNDKILTKVCEMLQSNPSIDGCYGDIRIIKNINCNDVKNSRIWKAGCFKRDKFRTGWVMPHPTLFVNRKVYSYFGNFRMDLGTSSDYEFMLRCFYFQKLTAIYVPTEFVIMRSGGKSSSSLKNRLLANSFDSKAWRVNGAVPPLFFRFLKPIRKVPQWITGFLSNLTIINK
jgi:glycosyltransferase involved in cell wall biosynthesis